MKLEKRVGTTTDSLASSRKLAAVICSVEVAKCRRSKQVLCDSARGLSCFISAELEFSDRPNCFNSVKFNSTRRFSCFNSTKFKL